MKNNLKNLFVMLISLIGMVQGVFAVTEAPYILENGLDTQLIENEPSLREYFNNSDQYPDNLQLHNVALYVLRYGKVRYTDEKDLYNLSKYIDSDYFIEKMVQGDVVVCPCFEVTSSSSGKEVKFPLAMLFDTRNTDNCHLVEEHRKKEQQNLDEIKYELYEKWEYEKRKKLNQ